MAVASVAIVSQDEDFHGVLAEQIKRECSAEVRVVENAAGARAIEPACVVASQPLPGKWPMPVIIVEPGKNAPIRLHDILNAVRQALKGAEDTMYLGDCVLSLSQKTLAHPASKQSTALTDKEVQLLVMLLKGGDTGVTKEALLKDIWGVETDLESHTLETHVYRLRSKLREMDTDCTISAVPGSYKMEKACPKN